LKQHINCERRPVREMAATTMLVPPVWEGELLVTQHSIRFSFLKVESDVVFLFFVAAIDFVVVDVEVAWAAGNRNVIDAQVV
jgi:hypothetical protein